MNKPIFVHAPCRLHFGMFSFGHVGQPQFGGVGAMIDPPAIDVEIKPAARFQVTGALADRAQVFAELAAAAWQLSSLPSCEIAIRAPSDHIGLGVGTQLGLAIAAGLRRFLKLPQTAVEDLAISVGRASRSAIGTHGFKHGGLIVDAGHERGQQIGVLHRRLAVPDNWRFLLVRPTGQRGIAGPREADAFARLPPVHNQVMRELWRITNEEMLPALQRRDCRAFGEAVYQFGRMAGECFAPVQGGPFATSELSLLVEAIRGRGVRGVGQSSWGPTVFAICDSHVEARSLSYGLWSHLRGRYDLTIASPNNEGAVIR